MSSCCYRQWMNWGRQTTEPVGKRFFQMFTPYRARCQMREPGELHPGKPIPAARADYIHTEPSEMDYGKENHDETSSSSYSLPSPAIRPRLLTCAAGVPIEAQGTLVAGASGKIRVASALASWAAVVVHRAPGIARASCKSRTLSSLGKPAMRGRPLLACIVIQPHRN